MNNSDFVVKKIELNKSGITNLLQSQPVMDTLLRTADDNYGATISAKIGSVKGGESVECVVGEIETTFVGFDRCHVICKDTGGQS